jgi:hypothetical protein
MLFIPAGLLFHWALQYDFGKATSLMNVTIGALFWYAPAWFTRERTATHDLLSGTRVRVWRV